MPMSIADQQPYHPTADFRWSWPDSLPQVPNAMCSILEFWISAHVVETGRYRGPRCCDRQLAPRDTRSAHKFSALLNNKIRNSAMCPMNIFSQRISNDHLVDLVSRFGGHRNCAIWCPIGYEHCTDEADTVSKTIYKGNRWPLSEIF